MKLRHSEPSESRATSEDAMENEFTSPVYESDAGNDNNMRKNDSWLHNRKYHHMEGDLSDLEEDYILDMEDDDEGYSQVSDNDEECDGLRSEPESDESEQNKVYILFKNYYPSYCLTNSLTHSLTLIL
jgi:hypothetical protein